MSSNWFVFSMEPSELEARFGSDSNLSYDPDSEQDQAILDLEEEMKENELKKIFREQISQVSELVQYLDPIERDYIHMYFDLNKDQNDIAKIFGITQGAVSYRCKTAVERLKFLTLLPRLSKSKLVRDLSKIMSDPIHVDILVLMYETSSQSGVARKLGFSQGQIRYRLLRSIEILEAFSVNDPIFKVYLKAFELIRKNPNIVRNMNISNFWVTEDEFMGNIDKYIEEPQLKEPF